MMTLAMLGGDRISPYQRDDYWAAVANHAAKGSRERQAEWRSHLQNIASEEGHLIDG
jgi:hypothetical protein